MKYTLVGNCKVQIQSYNLVLLRGGGMSMGFHVFMTSTGQEFTVTYHLILSLPLNLQGRSDQTDLDLLVCLKEAEFTPSHIYTCKTHTEP